MIITQIQQQLNYKLGNKLTIRLEKKQKKNTSKWLNEHK